MPDDARPDEAELLARPGAMRALWWSVCHGCGQRIEVGAVVILGTLDGRRWWLCAFCSTRAEGTP